MEQYCSTVLKEVSGFVDDLQEAVGKRISISAEFDKVCICGMGASAIGGDIMSDIAVGASDVPISVIRSFDLPGWVNKDTFVIVSSYSGDTRETLAMYDQAAERGCKIVAITAGGKLKEKCRSDGNKTIEMRPGVQPRNSLGLILGYTANIMESIGVGNHCTEMKELIPSLQRFRDDIGFGNPDSYAKKIAERLYGTTPIVHSTVGIAASAVRWKHQINENAKMMSFCGSIPEFNHNEILGWTGDRLNCIPVILFEENVPEVMRITAEKTIEVLKEYGIEPVVISIRGKTVTERSLRAVMLGDYVSIYLASMKGVDPIDVGPIRTLKKKVSEHLDR